MATRTYVPVFLRHPVRHNTEALRSQSFQVALFFGLTHRSDLSQPHITNRSKWRHNDQRSQPTRVKRVSRIFLRNKRVCFFSRRLYSILTNLGRSVEKNSLVKTTDWESQTQKFAKQLTLGTFCEQGRTEGGWQGRLVTLSLIEKNYIIKNITSEATLLANERVCFVL